MRTTTISAMTVQMVWSECFTYSPQLMIALDKLFSLRMKHFQKKEIKSFQTHSSCFCHIFLIHGSTKVHETLVSFQGSCMTQSATQTFFALHTLYKEFHYSR